MTKEQKAEATENPDPAVGEDAIDDEINDLEVADVGDTALIAIEKDMNGTSVTGIRPQLSAPSGNTRRRIEDYMEMKRAAKELHDLDDFDFEN